MAKKPRTIQQYMMWLTLVGRSTEVLMSFDPNGDIVISIGDVVSVRDTTLLKTFSKVWTKWKESGPTAVYVQQAVVPPYSPPWPLQVPQPSHYGSCSN